MTDPTRIDPLPTQPVHVASTPLGARPPRPPLPAVLQPWARWLDGMAPDQQQALGDLLRRLHPALGAYRGPVQRGGDSIAGVDELRRRGPYHRLLLSEWAMADAVPDEFLRRAGSGEHLFLSPRRETPRADAGIVAVFDGGPSQLGAPRLAQVALWILLARRAEAAGVGFAWGALDAPGALHPADSLDALRRFLSGRSFARPTTDLRDRWHDALANAEVPYGERWLLGGEDDPRFSHRVRLRRDLAGRLAIAIHGPSGRRHLDVPVPSAGSAQRLLRGEFGYRAMPQQMPDALRGRLSLQQPPLIASDGRRIAVPLLDDRGILIRVLPQSKSIGKPRPARDVMGPCWPAGQQPVCMALRGKRVAGLLAGNERLYFWQMDQFPTLDRPPADLFEVPVGQSRWLPCVWFNSGAQTQHLYVLDRRGRLLCWNGRDAGGQPAHSAAPTLIDTGVQAIARVDEQRLLYLRQHGQRPGICVLERGKPAGIQLATSPEPMPVPASSPRGLLAFGTFDGSDARAVAAHPPSAQGGPWQVWSVAVSARGTGRAPDIRACGIRVGEGWQAFGLCLMPGRWSPALVALSPDKRRVCAIDATGTEVLYASDAPVATVSTSTDGRLIALVTERRQLVVLHPDGSDGPGGDDRRGMP